MMEYKESVHIKKRIACQQHLAEVGPNPLGDISLGGIGGPLFPKERFGRRKFSTAWRAAVGQFKS